MEVSENLEKITSTPLEEVFFRFEVPDLKTDLESITSSIDHAGNPDIGTIHFYRQRHLTSGERDFQVQEIGKIQFLIAKDVLSSGVKAIFQEGALQASTHEELRDNHIGYELIVDTFTDGIIPEEPSVQQLWALAKYGASYVTATLNPEITIYPTVTQKEEDEFYRVMNDPDSSEKLIKETTFDRRERTAVRHVMEYLRESPGSDVAVIYGANHNFSKDRFNEADDNLIPRIISHKAHVHSSYVLSCELMEASEERQMEIIRKAPRIMSFAFNKISSDEGKILALSKLEVEFSFYKDADDLKDYLDYLSGGSEVVKRIIERFYPDDGPFKALRVKENVPWKLKDISEMDTHTVSNHIYCEYHPYTQYMLVLEARGVDYTVFGELRDNKTKFAAYEKLVIDNKKGDVYAEKLFDHLMYCSLSSDELRKTIKSDYEDRCGVFSGATYS